MTCILKLIIASMIVIPAFVELMPSVSAANTIIGGTGSSTTAAGAVVVGEVYESRDTYNFFFSHDIYELGILAEITQDGEGNSSVSWKTSSPDVVITHPELQAFNSTAPKYSSTFGLGASHVAASVSKTNSLGTVHAKAGVYARGGINGLPELPLHGFDFLEGEARIYADTSLSSQASGTVTATAGGNASYDIKENIAGSDIAPGYVPVQIWGSLSGNASSSAASEDGGEASAYSSIAAGSIAAGHAAGAGLSNSLAIGWGPNGKILYQLVLPGEGNKVLSKSSSKRDYDGASTASSFANEGVAQSGAWDGTVNDANPRTKGTSESAYSKVEGATNSTANTYLGGDYATSQGYVEAYSAHNNDSNNKMAIFYLPHGLGPNNELDAYSSIQTSVDSQRVTPGTDDSMLTSEAFVDSGNIITKARDELPLTTVARLVYLTIPSGKFGSGVHLVDQTTGDMRSSADSYWLSAFDAGNVSENKADNLSAYHLFNIEVAGPKYTGNILDDSGSYGYLGSEDNPITTFASRPKYGNNNSYASLSASIGGDNAIAWISGDDSRFHMRSQGLDTPVISEPTYIRVPSNTGSFMPGTKGPVITMISGAQSRKMSQIFREFAYYYPLNK